MSWLVFYDGECGMCSSVVRGLARWDSKGVISFASLQGDLALRLGLSHFAQEDGGSVVVLREGDGVIFLRADAVLELIRVLGWPWRFFLFIQVMPHALRDAIYRWIAKRRRFFLGNRSRCELLDPKVMARIRKG